MDDFQHGYLLAWPPADQIGQAFPHLVARRKCLDQIRFLAFPMPHTRSFPWAEDPLRMAQGLVDTPDPAEDGVDYESPPWYDAACDMESALDHLIDVLYRTEKEALELERPELFSKLASLGIHKGQACPVGKHIASHHTFVLDNAELSLPPLSPLATPVVNAEPQYPQLWVSGYRTTSRAKTRRTLSGRSFESLDDAQRELLGSTSCVDSGARVDPRTMPLDAVARELSAAVEDNHPALRAHLLPELEQALDLYREAVSPQPVGDHVLLRPESESLAIRLQLEVTSKNNLTIEWTLADGSLHESHRGYTFFGGSYRLQRLVHLPVEHSLRREEPLSWDPPRQQGRRARLHDLTVRLVVGAVRAYVQRLKAQFQVVRCSALPAVWRGEGDTTTPEGAPGMAPEGAPGGLALCLLHRCDDVPPEMLFQMLEPIERVTGLSEATLHRMHSHCGVQRLSWRTPSDADWAAWFEQVRDAGGNEMHLEHRPLTEEEQQAVLAFYRDSDPEQLELARQAQRMRELDIERQRELHRAERRQLARQALASRPVAARSGWSAHLAKTLGIHPTDVKNWLQRELPDVFKVLYPRGEGRAVPVADTKRFLQVPAQPG